MKINKYLNAYAKDLQTKDTSKCKILENENDNKDEDSRESFKLLRKGVESNTESQRTNRAPIKDANYIVQ